MRRSKSESAFLQGLADGTPFLLVLVPFAMLFGVVGTEAGLNITEVMGFAVLVIAGAAQFAALSQMQADAPTILVLATALAVNVRMAMYSASLTPWLGKAKLWQRALASYLLVDQSYVLSVAKFETEPDLTLSERLRYFAGIMVTVAPVWYGASLIGALVGKTIPESLALDFALPITFLAMIGPMLRTLPHVVAAATSVLLALALGALPYGSGLLIAAAAAMGAGALVEIALERRKS